MVYPRKHIETFTYSLKRQFDIFDLEDITTQNIIDHIEYLFDPERNDFEVFKYDENFSEKIKKKEGIGEFAERSLQIWCKGPVLIKNIDQ